MQLVQSTDYSIDWTCLLMKSVGLWLAADEAEQRRRNAALIYTISVIFIATCIAIRDIYFSWGNFSDCVYITCNILYLMIVLYKIGVLYTHRLEFFDLVRYTQSNFWHSNYSQQEKVILAECKRLCGVFIVVISFCCQGTCAGYLVTPLLANIGKNESDRILPFNMWVDFPTGTSPYYEVLFVIQADIPPSRNISLMLNLGGTLVQLFMFTYGCDGLIHQSASIGRATYSGPWALMPMDRIGKILRRNILLTILRSGRSCCLTANGFFPVSLETYTAVLSTAMSYFTLLRQKSVNDEEN
ncbi:odorant receptor 22c-like isoform X2 [Nomia melanderi]|uniref:odorant receptor 22c-like isoform X2 n=1 Tax=Nomia melanderi TaxID=2448451 RepID=UPI003FCCA3D7